MALDYLQHLLIKLPLFGIWRHSNQLKNLKGILLMLIVVIHQEGVIIVIL